VDGSVLSGGIRDAVRAIEEENQSNAPAKQGVVHTSVDAVKQLSPGITACATKRFAPKSDPAASVLAAASGPQHVCSGRSKFLCCTDVDHAVLSC